MTPRELIQQKVQQVIYGGDTYDAAEVFNTSEYTTAKRMFDDYSSHPNADDIVIERAETAIGQIEEVQG
jgi:hypothetical protein